MNAVYIALPFVQGVVALFLASMAMLSDPRDRLNLIFAGFLIALGFWGFLIFGMRDAFPDAVAAYSWEQAALVVIPFSGIIFYHFVQFAQGMIRNQWKHVMLDVVVHVPIQKPVYDVHVHRAAI